MPSAYFFIKSRSKKTDFSHKLVFLTPCYAHVHAHNNRVWNTNFPKHLHTYWFDDPKGPTDNPNGQNFHDTKNFSSLPPPVVKKENAEYYKQNKWKLWKSVQFISLVKNPTHTVWFRINNLPCNLTSRSNRAPSKINNTRRNSSGRFTVFLS